MTENLTTHLTEAQLNQSLDQMLESRAQDDVEAHLAVCVQCRSQLKDLAYLFSTLADLPDLPLARDLTPGVLARLPVDQHVPAMWQKPVFIIQSLLAILFFMISMPLLHRLVGSLSALGSEHLPLVLRSQSLSDLVSNMLPLLLWKPDINFTIPNLSAYLPTLPVLPAETDINIILMLVISAGLLWLVGNFTLLRNRPGLQE